MVGSFCMLCYAWGLRTEVHIHVFHAGGSELDDIEPPLLLRLFYNKIREEELNSQL